MKHLLIGGSTASRTINCPAWVERSKKVPKPPASVYARKGNLLHDAMELHYLQGTSFPELVGNLTFEDQTLAEEDLHLLDSAKRQVELIFDEYDADVFECEPFVEYERGLIGGSIDVLWRSRDFKTVGLIDYKFGADPVSAQKNDQLLFYAMSAKKDAQTAEFFENAERVVLAIVQPVVSPTPDIWTCKPSAIETFTKKLKKALKSTHASAGKHCKFCPAALTCPEKQKQAAATLVMDKGEAAMAAKSLELAFDLDEWVGEVLALAELALSRGAQIPGYKRVDGPGGPEVAPESDPRPSLASVDAMDSLRLLASKK